MKLAACMMGLTDTDARFLEPCLDSIDGLHDELIFVDTQSSKQSLAPVRDMGGKIYVHPWADDYSLHRNQSLSYVSDDVDWVFIIDPDEKMYGDIIGFREYLETLSGSVHCVSIPLHDQRDGKTVLTFNSPRCFRRGKLQYRYAKHNTPHITGESVICQDLIYLEHYGYDLTPEEMAAKDARTERLLIQRLKVNPKDYATHFYFAQHYGKTGDYERALKHIETYIGRRADLSTFNSSAYFTGYGLAMTCGDQQKAAQFIQDGLAHAPHDVDLTWALLELGQITDDTTMVYNGALRFAEAYERFIKDSTGQEERFVFRADPERYARALYHVGVMSAQMARNTLKKLFALAGDNKDSEKIKHMIDETKNNLEILKVKIAGLK